MVQSCDLVHSLTLRNWKEWDRIYGVDGQLTVPRKIVTCTFNHDSLRVVDIVSYGILGK